MRRRLGGTVLALMPVALAGCAGGTPQTPVQTVYAQAPLQAPATPAAGITSNGADRKLFTSASDSQCATNTDHLASGSTQITMLNTGSRFVTLSIRPSNATSASGDIYRL